MARLTVHIVTHNSAHVIDACLESLQQQCFRDFAVYVLDNGSEDGTQKKLAFWHNRGVNVALNPTNSYYSRAHNWLISQTSSEFVMTLNPDVLLTPEFLQEAVNAMAESPRIGSINGKLLLASADNFGTETLRQAPARDAIIDGAGLMMFRSRRPFLRGNRRRNDRSCQEQTLIFGADGAAAVYRRAMLHDVAIAGEIFDEDFVIYREDVDLAWRTQLLGWDCLYVPDALGYHVRGFRLGRGRSKMPAELKRHSVRNGWLIIVKNEISPRTLLRDVGLVAPYQAKIMAGLLLVEQSSLPAVRDMQRLWPRMMVKRSEIQKRRVRSDREMADWFY